MWRDGVEALEDDLHVPGDEIVDRHRAAFVRDMHDVDARHVLEQFSRHVPGRAVAGGRVHELARRQGDYASVGLAAHRLDSEIRLAFFGVGAKPILAKHAAAEAKKSIAAAQQALAKDLDPPADLYHSGAAKLHLSRVLLGRAFAQWNMK